jgi:hypothetical protein
VVTISLQVTDLNIVLGVAQIEAARAKDEISSHKDGRYIQELQVLSEAAAGVKLLLSP